MKKRKLAIWACISLLLIIMPGFLLYQHYHEQSQQEAQFTELREMAAIHRNMGVDSLPPADLPAGELQDSSSMEEIPTLQDANEDCIGWVQIPDTAVDYPVMQTKTDSEFYLKRDFYGNYSNFGTPFLDARCDAASSRNLIVYAHHMDDGSMFAALDRYKDAGYAKDHPEILLEINGEIRRYAVVASILQTGTYYEGEPSIYQYVDLRQPKEFEEFKEFINSSALIRTKEIIQAEDSFLTLSTCEYSQADGRIAVVARRILTS